jgi:hypothetical protein
MYSSSSRDIQTTDWCSAMNYEARYSSSARDIEATDWCSAVDFEAIYSSSAVYFEAMSSSLVRNI